MAPSFAARYLARMRNGVLVLALGLALGAAGCASLSRGFRNNMKEMFGRPPNALDSGPAATGLVVLDFSLSEHSWLVGEAYHDVHGAHIRRTAEGSPDLYAPQFEVRFAPVGVLFQGVPPGRYQVTELLYDDYVYNANTRTRTPTIRGWKVAHDPELSFEVAAGKVTFVGPFSAYRHKRRMTYRWQSNPEREREVWRVLRTKYSPSRWDTALDQRIAELERSGR